MAWRRSIAPHAAVVVPTMDRSSWLASMILYLAEGAHQIAEITVMHSYNPALPSQSWRTPAGSVWAENTPVHIRFGWYDDDSGDFYGYIASHQILASENDARYGYAIQIPVVYTLVGATMPMQSRANRAWQDTTVSGIARDIAATYQLAAHVDTSAVRFESRFQASSDWQFLADLTHPVGYRLYPDASTIWFVSQRTVMPNADGSVPLFVSQKTPGVVDSLRAFTGLLGDTDPGGGLRATHDAVALRTTSGVMTPASYAQPRSNAQGQAVTPLLRQQYTHRPARSWSAAEEFLSQDVDWLWVQAQATVNGDPRLRPGTLCDLQGAALAETHTGRWMVRSATHTITPNHLDPRRTEYTCDLVLGRDQPDRLSVSPASPPTVSAAPTVLVRDRWRSAHASTP